jgi:hypothetical protein
VRTSSELGGILEEWLVLFLAALVLLVGLLTIWAWAISTARQQRRECTLLLQEGVTTRGLILEAKGSWSPEGCDRVKYQFEDADGRVWRGRDRILSIGDPPAGETLITYARSDPSVNRHGDWTRDFNRRKLARCVKKLPFFYIYVLVGIGGGLSIGLIKLVWRGVQWFS